MSSSTIPAHAIPATVARMTRDEAKILAHYSAGETVRHIATTTGLDPDEIGLTIDALTGGDRQRAHALAVEWQNKAKAVAAAKGKPAPPPEPAAVPAQAPTPVSKAAQDTATDLIADLLNRASATDIPRLVRAAEKISDQIDQLEKQLAEHEHEQALRAEAAQLETRLAEIKQQLSPRRPPAITEAVAAATASADSKNIRAWAAANNIDCPAHGRVPAYVVAAYEQKAATR